MKKIYLMGLVTLLFSHTGFSQCTISGETTPTCESGPVQNLTTTGDYLIGPGITGNDFDPSMANLGSNTINAIASDLTTYTVDQTGTFAPVVFNTPTAVTLGDDETSVALPIGFSFTFFEVNYTDFYISSNGFLAFSAEPNGCCTGQFLPDAAQPNNLIAFAWEDLDPGNGGQPAQNLIQYETQGTAPNRKLIVEFFNVDHYPSGNQVTSQIIMYEGSNIIEIHTTAMPSEGGMHTQGIENAAGTVAYTVPGRNSADWSATNDYVAFIPGSICASITIDVNSSTVNTNVTNNSPTLESEAIGAAYQWIDCNNGNQPIAGETDSVFVAQANGSYAVIVTEDGCTDTSACETVDNVGLSDLEISSEVTVSPNPSVGVFHVTSSILIKNITVYDNTGKVIETIKVDDLNSIIQITDASKGIYILKIETPQGVITKNIIKQ